MRFTAICLVMGLVVLGAWSLSGCVAGPGGDVVVPVSQKSFIKGEVRLDSILVGGLPLTYPVRAWGEGTLHVYWPGPNGAPVVDFSGDGNWVIEPITPTQTAEVQSLVASGNLILGRNTIQPSGTISTLRGR